MFELKVKSSLRFYKMIFHDQILRAFRNLLKMFKKTQEAIKHAYQMVGTKFYEKIKGEWRRIKGEAQRNAEL